jgi:hypothetical protein
MSDLIHHSSESNEHFTDPEVVEAGRDLMGRIELDPASNYWLNERVIRADCIYTRADNGYLQPWIGNTFLNPPGGLCDDQGRLVLRATKTRKDCRLTGSCGLPKGHEHRDVTSSMKAWWFKLVQEWKRGRVPQAVFIGFSIEVLQTTQNKVPKGLPPAIRFPFCIPRRRLAYWHWEGDQLVKGGSPTHASVIIYLPHSFNDIEKQTFKLVFSKWGECVWPDTMVVR